MLGDPKNGQQVKFSLPPRQVVPWPADLTSLKGVTFASGVFRYIVDNLADAKVDSNNTAQRQLKSAVKLAYDNSEVLQGLGTIWAAPRDGLKLWRQDVMAACNEVQRRLVDAINNAKAPNTGGRRCRCTQPYVTSVVRAYASPSTRPQKANDPSILTS